MKGLTDAQLEFLRQPHGTRVTHADIPMLAEFVQRGLLSRDPCGHSCVLCHSPTPLYDLAIRVAIAARAAGVTT